jgi:hypothetical protein
VVFATQEISFLGHLVLPAGVRIDPDRTRAIREFSTPRNTRGISRFIGMVNFYHKFIPQLANLAAPLNTLRKKGVKFAWGQEQQEAFEALKQFILQTNASSVALRAVLLQECDSVRQPMPREP